MHDIQCMLIDCQNRYVHADDCLLWGKPGPTLPFHQSEPLRSYQGLLIGGAPEDPLLLWYELEAAHPGVSLLQQIFMPI